MVGAAWSTSAEYVRGEPTVDALPGERLDIVRRKAEQWADELTDFGPYNTLLHYKDSRTLTVDLTAADPEQLRRLLGGSGVRLSALLRDPEEQGAACVRIRGFRRRTVFLAEEQGIEVGRIAHGLLRVRPPVSRGTAPLRPLCAPLLLQPVRVEPRTSAETDYLVEPDGEVEVNPVLLVALHRHYGVEFDPEALSGELDDLVVGADGPDEQLDAVAGALNSLLTEQQHAVEVEHRVVVGCFNFDKLPMVQDLRTSAELLAQHDVVAAAAGYRPAVESLRGEAREYRLRDPDDVPPVDEFLVHDADSSQHRAAMAVLDGQHVVIQGPPGTGKSQTIANIIASAAALGKRTLFVAEKRAAIEAVTDLLAEVDLDELVFDLHGQKLSRRQVAEQVAASLDRLTRAMPPNVEGSHRKLVETRRALVRHDEELHANRAPWGPSAYEVYEALLGLLPRAATDLRIADADLGRLDHSTIEKLGEEVGAFVAQGGPALRRGDSAWSRADVREEGKAQELLARLDSVTGPAWRDSQSNLAALVDRAGLRRPDAVAGWQQVLGLLAAVECTTAQHGEDVYGDDLDEVCYAVAGKRWRAEHPARVAWWRRFKLRRRARTRRRDGTCTREVLAGELQAAVHERDLWRALTRDGAAARPCALELRGEFDRFCDLRDELAAVALCAQFDSYEHWPADQLTARLSELRAERGTLFRLPELARITEAFESAGLAGVLDEVTRRDADPDEARDLLWHVWYQSLLDRYRFEAPALGHFNGQVHDRAVAEFRSADAQHLRLNAQRIRRRVAERLMHARDACPEQNARVLGEAKRKRGHLPVRKLVAAAPDVLLAARPCWAMSPIVVSRLLPAERLFDIVVFDEGSQVDPVDAMTSIMRGSQLVVAGDDKQLPPSRFFATAAQGIEPEDDELDDDVPPPPQVGDFESVLTCLAAFVPQSFLLRWHYRSADERLIAFSNEEFYDGELVTFPGPTAAPPVTLEVVSGHADPGAGGLVDEEVRRVVDLVIAHARECPHESLGVITANVKHVDRIEGALRTAAAEWSELAEYRVRMAGPRKRLFVKSLESVQGDERDVIVLSIGRAKGADGRLPMKFGPLNLEGGERRLNVAITRARKRMVVVSSFTHEDMTPDWPTKGPEMLRRFLESTATGARPAEVGRAQLVEMNALERQVQDELRSRGIPVVPQWGVSGYRIDFALVDPERPGRMVLALEIDGDRYHRLRSARDRDRLRQTHLERIGWSFHRVWASEWFSGAAAQADRIEQRWRQVLRSSDALPSDDDRREPEPDQAVPSRGPRPPVPPGLRIDQYSDELLDRIAWWLVSDRLPLDGETRLQQMKQTLGFARNGSRIVQRCTAALDRARMAAADRER